MPLTGRLLAACAAHGDRVAVVDDDGEHTYAQLDEASARIARGLGARGVGPGEAVGLLAPRGWWRCAAVLGVWRAGAAVVALDPTLPAPRLAAIARGAGISALLHDGAAPPPGLGPTGGPQCAVRDLHDAAPSGDGPCLTGPVAYVVATSGSTGTPKCVAVPPVVLEDLAAWHTRTWPWPQSPTTAHAASVGFDVAFQELVTTWAAGAALVVVDDRARRDPFLLASVLEERAVVRAFLPVASLHALAVAVPVTGHRLPALREVVVAGERLVVNEEVRALFDGLDACLVNQYGPSETHVVTEHRLGPDPRSWPVHPPLGGPVASAELLRVLDGVLAPFAEGDEAELVVAGDCLAVGYLGDARGTAAGFRRLPDGAGGERRVYLTGDLVRLRDGLLHFVGRIDDQLKVRGYRVEPGEIEAVLARVPGVRRAAVVGHGTERTVALRAYVVPEAGAGPLDPSALREACAAALPDYMVPARFVGVAELPLTPNGKVARRELGDLARTRG